MQYLYPNIDRRFLCPDEFFVEISKEAFPEIDEGYLVSNYCRIYDTKAGRFIKITPNVDGYGCMNLRLKNGRRRVYYIHRIAMISMLPVDGYKDLQVNHRDGNKSHNRLWNYEWITPLGNNLHSVELDLTLTGENAPWTKVTNEQVHEICKLHIQGMNQSDIARTTGCGVWSVSMIIKGRNRTDISSLYGIVPDGKDLRSRPKQTSRDQVVCVEFND